jgi:hypothetical protein
MWIFMVPAMVRTAPEPHAELARGFKRGFNQLGVIRQAEIVVAGEVDDLLAVVMADRGLLIVEDAQAEVGAFLLEAIEDIGQIGELRTRRGGSHAGHLKQEEYRVRTRTAGKENELFALDIPRKLGLEFRILS